MKKIIYHLTWEELSNIVGRAEIAYRKDYETYKDARDLMLANLCKEIFENSIETDGEFYTITEDKPF